MTFHTLKMWILNLANRLQVDIIAARIITEAKIVEYIEWNSKNRFMLWSISIGVWFSFCKWKCICFLRCFFAFHVNSSGHETCFKWRLTRSHGQIHVGVYIQVLFAWACGCSVFVVSLLTQQKCPYQVYFHSNCGLNGRKLIDKCC